VNKNKIVLAMAGTALFVASCSSLSKRDPAAIARESKVEQYKKITLHPQEVYQGGSADEAGTAAACDDEAADCFYRAIARAREQGARALELRAASDLARLLQRRGRTVEAKQALSDVYTSFTEGFATSDLRDAKALLDAWSVSAG